MSLITMFDTQYPLFNIEIKKYIFVATGKCQNQNMEIIPPESSRIGNIDAPRSSHWVEKAQSNKKYEMIFRIKDQ